MNAITRALKVLILGSLVLFAASCGQQPQLPQIPGVQGPNFHVQNGSILISLQLEQVNVPTGGRFPIPKLDNSYFELTPAQFGGTFFQVTLDLNDIESNDFRFVDPNALPGGRPLPGIVGGVLPTLAVNVPSLWDATFYVSKQIFGFFLPIKMNVDAILTYPLYLQGNHIGNLSLVGTDENRENSGFLLLMNLNNAGREELNKLIKTSKKKANRHKIY